MFCPNCGTENAEGSTICQSCGTSLTSPAPQPSAQATVRPAPTSGLATASLIFGILGLTLLPTLGSVVAVILGYMAKSEINSSAGQLEGSGLATAGLVLGYIGLGLTLLGIVAVLLGWLGICGCSLCSLLSVPFMEERGPAILMMLIP
jgi:membrane protein YqaA with SNARE-associated domain